MALLTERGRVVGAQVQTPKALVTIRARFGVVLACGGFARDVARKKALLPHAPTGQEHWSSASRGNTGDGLRLGEAAGGWVPGLAPADASHAAALAPVSLVPQKDGSEVNFPHLIERAKPGLIAVTPQGQRFCNEADSYFDVVQALLKVIPAGQPAHAWLLCDHAFIRRYGLGAVKPAPMPLRHWLKNGYLKRAANLALLAQVCDVPFVALRDTIARYNGMAALGKDDDFGKGETPYNRIQGDAASGRANPCMAPLVKGPFYAMRRTKPLRRFRPFDLQDNSTTLFLFHRKSHGNDKYWARLWWAAGCGRFWSHTTRVQPGQWRRDG